MLTFFRCQKYHKSWSNGAAELHNSINLLHISVDLLCDPTAAEQNNSINLLHISVDLLCGTTATKLHKSVDLLCDATAAELHSSVNLLCGTTTAELNCRFDACTGIRRHFSKTVTNHAEKDEGFGWFSNNRSMYALRRFRRWSGYGQNLALGPWASPWATLWATLWATPRKAKK